MLPYNPNPPHTNNSKVHHLEMQHSIAWIKSRLTKVARCEIRPWRTLVVVRYTACFGFFPPSSVTTTVFTCTSFFLFSVECVHPSQIPITGDLADQAGVWSCSNRIIKMGRLVVGESFQG